MLKLKQILKANNEYLTIVLALIIFMIQPYLFRLIDPTATPADPGSLSLITMAVIAVLVFLALTWMIISMTWPSIREYFEDHFVRNFKVLTPCLKVTISLSLYFLLFFSFLLALVALR